MPAPRRTRRDRRIALRCAARFGRPRSRPALAAGGALFALLVRTVPGPAHRAGDRRRGVAGASAIAAVGLHGAALLDASVRDGASWRMGFATTRGPAAIAASAGAAAIAAGALCAAEPGDQRSARRRRCSRDRELRADGPLRRRGAARGRGDARSRARARRGVLGRLAVALLASCARSSGADAARALSRFSRSAPSRS